MSRSDCDAIRPLISAALDGDLDEDEFVQLSEHLSECARCRQVHQDYFQLRDGLRSTTPPPPPPQLARNVWKETVEKPPPPAIVRLASRTGVRLGMSTMAASVVALLVAVLFLAHGIDQRSIPIVASSQPAQGSVQEWPISRPIEIEFSKEMNRDSVERNLIIQPTTEQERLPISWSGNTLIIGRSEEQSVLLRPETDYRITILEHAEDRHGNPIGDFWLLQFRTGAPDVAIATPSPDSDDPTEAQQPDQAADDEWISGQGDSEDGDNEDDVEPSGQDGDSSGADASSGEDASSDESSDQSTGDTAEPLNNGESGDDSGEAAPEPTAEPEAEPEPTPTVPKPTPTPQPTATPRPEPTPQPTQTPEPSPSATAEPIGVLGAFGEVYWGNESVQNALGDPIQKAHSFIAAEQEFQRGTMFRQYYQDRNAIFVFVNGGALETYDFDFDPDEDSFPVEKKGDGLYQPGGYFGKIWSERSLSDAIGYSVSERPVENVDAAIQQFDGGTLLYSRGNVYVIRANGEWDVYSVRSGSDGGFQNDDPDRESDQDSEPGESDPAETDEETDEDPADGESDHGSSEQDSPPEDDPADDNGES